MIALAVGIPLYLGKNDVNANLHIINGSVEIAPNIGLADGICDIVSSGSTLFKNGLKEIEVLLKSEAVLATSPMISKENQEIINNSGNIRGSVIPKDIEGLLWNDLL